MEIHVHNQTGRVIELCYGEKESSLGSGEKATIDVEDGDCLYLD